MDLTVTDPQTPPNNLVSLVLRRDSQGLRLRFRVAPEIEQFFRDLSGGTSGGVSHGRSWVSPSGQKMMFWGLDKELGEGEDGQRHYNYTVVPLGTELLGDSPNISFLRMVGASEQWQEFRINRPVSSPELERTAKRLQTAIERFYGDYLQQTGIAITITTQQA